jgi:hypothetical protein
MLTAGFIRNDTLTNYEGGSYLVPKAGDSLAFPAKQRMCQLIAIQFT